MGCEDQSAAPIMVEPRCSVETLNIDGDKAVVLFTASWSGPDKMLTQVLESVAGRYPKVTLHKINVDEFQDHAKSCEIRSVPTVIAFVGGRNFETLVGAASEDKIEQLFKGVDKR
jgi:thioredoxin 1